MHITQISVQDLKTGNVLVNMGRVMAVGRVGAFIVVRHTACSPSLADGTLHTSMNDAMFHESEEVWVEAD